MKVGIIGSGGREHAICYKLKQSPKIKKLVCIPGNAGTQKIAENIKEDIPNPFKIKKSLSQAPDLLNQFSAFVSREPKLEIAL